jgi:hypothetical protein
MSNSPANGETRSVTAPRLRRADPAHVPDGTKDSPVTDVLKRGVLTTILIAAWLSILFFLFIRIVAVWLEGHTKDPVFGGLVLAATFVVLCALPVGLMICIAIVVEKSISPRLAFVVGGAVLGLSHQNDAAPTSLRPEEWTSIVDDATRFWRYEAQQIDFLKWRFRHHGFVYGFICSVVLSLCAMLLAQRLIYGPARDVTQEAFRVPAAIAVGTATSVAFARDIGRLLVRAAHRDSSTQMLAWASKRLLVIVTGTVMAVGLALSGEFGADFVKSGLGYFVVGAGMAVLGDRAANVVGDRVARFFGAPTVTRNLGVDMQQIEGLTEDDMSRLAEENVDSAHALAFCSTPKLFLNTPYTLQRLCDWQDQALLIATLGETRARLFRDQLGVRGAIDAQQVALRYMRRPPAANDGQKASEDHRASDLRKSLGLSEDQMDVVMTRLANEDVARRLRIYRSASPGIGTSQDSSRREPALQQERAP